MKTEVLDNLFKELSQLIEIKTSREKKLKFCLQSLIRATKPIVDKLQEVGEKEGWEKAGQTSRVYTWFEVAPLRDVIEDVNTILKGKP